MTHTTTRRGAVGAAMAALVALLLAWSGAAQAQERWPALNDAGPKAGDGSQDAALIIGVEDYFFAPDIEGARSNADAWYAWLVRSRGVPASRVTLLRDREGTRETIQEGLERVAGQVGPGGTLWFVFIGHGAPAVGAAGGGVLVGADAQLTAKSLEARSLAQADVEAALAKRAGEGPTVAVLDACFSGRTPSGAALVPNLQPLVPKQNTASTSRMTVLTASEADQFAGPLPGAQRPAFSYLVLGALRGWGDANDDQQVTAREAIDYAQETLQTVLKDRSQRPQLTGAALSAPLSQGASEPGPDIAALVLSGVTSMEAPPEEPPAEVAIAVRPVKASDAGQAQITTLRLNVGFTGLAPEVLDALGGEFANIAYRNSDGEDASGFEDLSISDTAAQSNLFGATLDLVFGEGFSSMTTLGVAWSGDANVATKVSADTSLLNDDLAALGNGVDGTIRDVLVLQSDLLIGYRHTFAPVSVWAYGGGGLWYTKATVNYAVGGVENTLELSDIALSLPLRAGLDVELVPNLLLSASGTYYVTNGTTFTANAGVGYRY